MRNPQAVINGQPLAHLPVILRKAFVGVVGDVVDTVERCFRVITQDAQKSIRIRVSCDRGGAIPLVVLQVSVRVVVGGLRIPDVLPEKTALHRVRAPHLGHSIAQAGHPLVGIQTLAGTAVFKASGIEDEGAFRVVPPVAAKRRDVFDSVLEQPGVSVAHIARSTFDGS